MTKNHDAEFRFRSCAKTPFHPRESHRNARIFRVSSSKLCVCCAARMSRPDTHHPTQKPNAPPFGRPEDCIQQKLQRQPAAK